MNKHPDDYDLWYLGTWDDENGCLEANSEEIHEQLAIGKNCILKKNH